MTLSSVYDIGLSMDMRKVSFIGMTRSCSFLPTFFFFFFSLKQLYYELVPPNSRKTGHRLPSAA